MGNIFTQMLTNINITYKKKGEMNFETLKTFIVYYYIPRILLFTTNNVKIFLFTTFGPFVLNRKYFLSEQES